MGSDLVPPPGSTEIAPLASNLSPLGPDAEIRPGGISASGAINISKVATSGSGTQESPWTGWDTIAWEGREYYFPAGYYAYSKTLNFAKQGIHLHGEGTSTVLMYRGVGACIAFDGSATGGTNDVRMESFLIKGNREATFGIYVDAVHRGILKHIRITDVSKAGFMSAFSVFWRLEDIRITYNESKFNTKPINGFVLGEKGKTATAYVIESPVVEGVSANGIEITNGYSNSIIGGSCEENHGYGLKIDADSHDNSIIGTDIEANSINISGTHNTLIGIISGPSDSIVLSDSASSNIVLGGTFGRVAISPHATYNKFENCRVILSWADSGIGTATLNVYNLYSHAWITSKMPSMLAIQPVQIMPGAGTGLTVNSNGHVNRQLYVATADSRFFYGPDNVADRIIATLPNRTRIAELYVVVDVPFSGGSIGTATMRIGTGAGGNNLLDEWDVASGPSRRGFEDADMGSSLKRGATTGGSFPTWDGMPTPIYVRLTTTGGKTGAVTAGSATFYIVTEFFGF